DPLLLPSGELGGMMVLPVSQPNNCEFLSSLAPASARSGAAVEERELYVLERTGPGQEIEPLEHESDLSIPDACQRIPREMGDVVSVEDVAPGGHRVEAPQEVHEGGLARPRRSHDCHKLADPDLDPHSPEGVNHLRSHPVVFDHPL